MEFSAGEQVVRERRTMVTDPYKPSSQVLGPWTGPLDELVLERAFVSSSSSVSPVDATRRQVLTDKSLYCTDPDVDVRVGDRIRRGTEIYYVNARPEADQNPFTGWRPVVEIPLDMTEG